MRTRILIGSAVALVAGTVLTGLLTGLLTFYGVGGGHSLNSGVRIGTDTHNVGVEWRGTPGFFSDNN